MLIKCTHLYNEQTNEYIEGITNGFITKGNIYHVLEIIFDGEKVHYRVNDDSDIYSHPILVRSNDFEIVSEAIPKNWVFITHKDRKFSKLGPEKWVKHDYWRYSFLEDWGDSIPEALQCYEDKLKIIYDADKDYFK